MLETSQFTLSRTFLLRLCNFDLTSFGGFLEFLLASQGILLLGSSTLALFDIWTVLSVVLSASFFQIFSAEIDELLAQVNLLLVGVSLKFLELLQFPLTALGLLLFTAFLLLGSLLSTLLLALLSHTLALVSPLFLLLAVFLVTLFTLDDHLLGLRDPLDVLDQSLLDLVVAHTAIETLFELVFLLAHGSGLFKILLDLYGDVGQVILLQLLFLLVHRLIRLDR